MCGAIARSLRRKSGVGRGSEVPLLDGHQRICDPAIVSCDGRSENMEVRCACHGVVADFAGWMVAGRGWRKAFVLVGRREIGVSSLCWSSAIGRVID